jgi:uncharacterized protein YjbI with pentapeptide repeats
VCNGACIDATFCCPSAKVLDFVASGGCVGTCDYPNECFRGLDLTAVNAVADVVNFRGADFREANLSTATFAAQTRLDLDRANFAQADLSGANLYGVTSATAVSADFDGASLRNTAFGSEVDTTLRGATFRGADFTGAYIWVRYSPNNLPVQAQDANFCGSNVTIENFSHQVTFNGALCAPEPSP